VTFKDPEILPEVSGKLKYPLGPMLFEGFRWIAGARVVHGGGGVAET